MGIERTIDPGVVIEERGTSPDGVPFVRYATNAGERWVIRGTCIACGECEVGAVNPNARWTGVPVGQPGACLDVTFGTPGRLDVPVRPELRRKMPHCTLWGQYLAGLAGDDGN